MKEDTFDNIRKEGRLLYEYIRGSRAYGTEKSDGSSDEDHGGVFMEPLDKLLGLGLDIQNEVSSDRNDDTWFRFGRFCELISKSNPNILEALFIPDNCIIYEHPIITELKKYRDKFITKQCFPSFIGYARQQIYKARSLGKKVVIPDDTPEPFVIDSVFTFYKQGSQPIKEWLSERGLNQKYCGLVNIPNCTCNLSCFYDWGRHVQLELGINSYDSWLNYVKEKPLDRFKAYIINWFGGESKIETKEFYDEYLKESLGYHGIVKDDLEKDSKQVRLSSVRKGEKPICIINFDINAYSQRCIKYKQWQDWKKCRNEERYAEVKNHDRYDKKNCLHSIRLLNMGLEIAKGKGFNVDRRGIDADYLKSIRKGKFTYEEIMSEMDGRLRNLDKICDSSTIPEKIDLDWFNDLVIDLRRKYYNLD